MPRSYRRYIATITGLAIVAAVLWLLVRDLSAVDLAYSHAAADASVKYERDADAYVKKTCFPPSGFGEVNCAGKADEAKREGQRKEQDLAAQNITAWWTKIMGIAALIGMGLSAVGVWLVKTTFDETRLANVLAESHQRARMKPLLEVGNLDADGLLPCGIKGENIGVSVALNVSATFRLLNSRGDPVNESERADFDYTVKPGASESFAVFIGPSAYPQRFYVDGEISYTCIFGRRHIEPFKFKVEYRKRSPLDIFIVGISAYSVAPLRTGKSGVATAD